MARPVQPQPPVPVVRQLRVLGQSVYAVSGDARCGPAPARVAIQLSVGVEKEAFRLRVRLSRMRTLPRKGSLSMVLRVWSQRPVQKGPGHWVKPSPGLLGTLVVDTTFVVATVVQ